MLDPYADLTPEEEATVVQAERQVSAKALRQAAERDAAWAKEQAQMERVTPPHPPDKPVKSRSDQPVIAPDADEHNANWLRILEQRRQEREGKDTDEPQLPPTPQQQQQKEQPTDG